MKILAIESSGPVASAAVVKDGQVIAEEKGPFKVTHSETLLPLISKCLSASGTDVEDVDFIAVSGGPGSFTGLRVGSATAKGLGFALGKELVHVPTLCALAENLRGRDDFSVPLMDARRGQVYTGIYRFEGENLVTVMEQAAMSVEDLISEVNERCDGGSVIFLGDGAEVFADALSSGLRVRFSFADEEDMLQRASSVGLCGWRMALSEMSVSADKEAPEYLRPSQAERVREERGRPSGAG